MPPGLAAAAGGQVAFRAPGGLPGASVVAVGAVILLLFPLMSGYGLMLLIRLHSGLFGAVCVALFPPLQCALSVSCRCWLLGTLLVCYCSCAGHMVDCKYTFAYSGSYSISTFCGPVCSSLNACSWSPDNTCTQTDLDQSIVKPA